MKLTEVERQWEILHGAKECVKTDIIRRVTRSEDPLRDELLWGIPNEVTLNHIATLLPRRAYEVLATVNPGWQRAFEGRMVYDARVRSQTMQTFLVVECTIQFQHTFSIFSPSEERWYKLPPVPGCRVARRLRSNLQYVLLDGSIYIFGGTSSTKTFRGPSAEVLVLDLVRHPLEWRRCADMQISRLHPKIGVMHGKIFVFGGSACSWGCCFDVRIRNEVYDPKVDAWSFIAPTMPVASVLNVFSVGQQFFACIGWIDRPRMNLKAEGHVRNEEADISPDAKFVIRVRDGSPKLIGTSDDNADDDMDGLHEVIQRQLVDLGKDEEYRQWSPAKDLALAIRDHEEIDSFLGTPEAFYGFYDPIKDEWSAFDKSKLGTDNVGQDWGPKNLGTLNLRRRLEDGRATACVWSMSL